MGMSANLRSRFWQDFLNQHGKHPLFDYSIFEVFREGDKEKEYSPLSIDFDNKNKSGNDTNAPLQFYGWRMPMHTKPIDGDEGQYESC